MIIFPTFSFLLFSFLALIFVRTILSRSNDINDDKVEYFSVVNNNKQDINPTIVPHIPPTSSNEIDCKPSSVFSYRLPSFFIKPASSLVLKSFQRLVSLNLRFFDYMLQSFVYSCRYVLSFLFDLFSYIKMFTFTLKRLYFWRIVTHPVSMMKNFVYQVLYSRWVPLWYAILIMHWKTVAKLINFSSKILPSIDKSFDERTGVGINNITNTDDKLEKSKVFLVELVQSNVKLIGNRTEVLPSIEFATKFVLALKMDFHSLPFSTLIPFLPLFVFIVEFLVIGFLYHELYTCMSCIESSLFLYVFRENKKAISIYSKGMEMLVRITNFLVLTTIIPLLHGLVHVSDILLSHLFNRLPFVKPIKDFFEHQGKMAQEYLAWINYYRTLFSDFPAFASQNVKDVLCTIPNTILNVLVPPLSPELAKNLGEQTRLHQEGGITSTEPPLRLKVTHLY